MNNSITIESEGKLQKVSIESLNDYLNEMYEISNSPEDFIKKVTLGLTDETFSLSSIDQKTILDWFKSKKK